MPTSRPRKKAVRKKRPTNTCRKYYMVDAYTSEFRCWEASTDTEIPPTEPRYEFCWR